MQLHDNVKHRQKFMGRDRSLFKMPESPSTRSKLSTRFSKDADIQLIAMALEGLFKEHELL